MKGYNRVRSPVITKALRQGELIPLRKLLKMSHAEMYQPQIQSIAYAQSWSFVYYLMTYKHRDKKIQKRVRNFNVDYFWALHDGLDPVEAVDVIFKDVNFDVLEASWKEAITKQK